MADGVTITATCADGRPLKAFSDLIAQRMKWLGESSEQACRAVMIDALVSLRAVTKVAKPKKTEIQLELASGMTFSYSQQGGKKTPCIRRGKTRVTSGGNVRIAFVNTAKGALVFTWKDKREKRTITWYVVATSKNEALRWAFEKLKKRANAYKGLAKAAMGMLMKGSGSKTAPSADGTPDAQSKASQLTQVKTSGDGKRFSIQADDLLQYAQLALKGGPNEVALALMRAANKVSSVLHQKCKNILGFPDLGTPFPEVRKIK